MSMQLNRINAAVTLVGRSQANSYVSTYANSRSTNLSRGKTAGVDSAIRRIDSGAHSLAFCESTPLQIPASPMLVNDRYTKQSAERTHFYTLQSEGQFNCGGRPIRASAIFSASNRPPGIVNVCARTALPMTFTFILTRRSMES